MRTSEECMRIALALAEEAAKEGETPVGCVITDRHSGIIGRGRNRRESTGLATAHAEIEAINEACRHIGDWRLDGCSMYVTLEPCPMCAGAVIMSRIGSMYYGAKDEITGSCGSVINLFMEPYGCKTRVTGGVLEEECSAILKEFFGNLRGQAGGCSK